MNKRVRKFLGNLFISSTAFLWTACDSDSASAAQDISASNEPRPFIDIEKELSKLEKPDTTGLRGTTVSGYKACIAGILAAGPSEYTSYIGDDGEFEAKGVVDNRIEEFLESPKGAALSDSIRNCYKSAKYLISAGALDYGVIPCGSYPDEVIVDDQYINNLLKADEIKRSSFKNSLERVNEYIADCDSLK